MQAISQICGFPVERITLESRLGADLGFDSLLAVELHHKLASFYPALAGTERHLLVQDVTVTDVLRLIEEGKVKLDPFIAYGPMSKVNDYLTAMAEHKLEKRMVMDPRK